MKTSNCCICGTDFYDTRLLIGARHIVAICHDDMDVGRGRNVIACAERIGVADADAAYELVLAARQNVKMASALHDVAKARVIAAADTDIGRDELAAIRAKAMKAELDIDAEAARMDALDAKAYEEAYLRMARAFARRDARETLDANILKLEVGYAEHEE